MTLTFLKTAPRSPKRSLAPLVPAAGWAGTIESAPLFIRATAPSDGAVGGFAGRPCRTPSEPKGRAVRRQAGANAPAAIGLAPSCAATVEPPARLVPKARPALLALRGRKV